MPESQIEILGTLAGEAGGKPGDGVWVGGVSPEKRKADGEVTQEEIDTFTNPETLDSYFVPADPKAPARCIDGRPSVPGTAREGALGPQLPGGSPMAAMVHRIVDGESMPPDNTFTDDIDDTLAIFKKHGIGFGGHIDDHNKHHDEYCGCGAIDKIPQILDILANPAAQAQIKNLLRTLLGAAYNEQLANAIFAKIQVLHDRESQYLEEDGVGADGKPTYAYRKKWIKSVEGAAEEEHRPVEELEGPHNEVMLVVNTVPNTTLDRDRLNADSGGNVQVFNYDVWRSFDIAKMLYPNDPGKQQEFVMTRVMFAAATAMALTDGSVRLAVRTTQ